MPHYKHINFYIIFKKLENFKIEPKTIPKITYVYLFSYFYIFNNLKRVHNLFFYEDFKSFINIEIKINYVLKNKLVGRIKKCQEKIY